MTTKTEEKILDKLERIEYLLIKVIPRKNDLTEEEVLKIIEDGELEYTLGKTKELESLAIFR